MKMVMVVYNEAIDSDVMKMLLACGIKNYTKAPSVFGKGVLSGAHFGNDIWPGRNMMLYVACLPEEAAAVMAGVRNMRKDMDSEGIKAFSWALEDIS